MGVTKILLRVETAPVVSVDVSEDSVTVVSRDAAVICTPRRLLSSSAPSSSFYCPVVKKHFG